MEICQCSCVFLIVMQLNMTTYEYRKHHKDEHSYSQQNSISMTVPAFVFKHSKVNLAVRRTMWNTWTAAAVATVMWRPCVGCHHENYFRYDIICLNKETSFTTLLWMMCTSYKYCESHYFRSSYKLGRVLQIDKFSW